MSRFNAKGQCRGRKPIFNVKVQCKWQGSIPRDIAAGGSNSLPSTKASATFNCVPKEENSEEEEERTRLKQEMRDQAIHEVEMRFEKVQANSKNRELLEIEAIIIRDMAISEVLCAVQDGRHI